MTSWEWRKLIKISPNQKRQSVSATKELPSRVQSAVASARHPKQMEISTARYPSPAAGWSQLHNALTFRAAVSFARIESRTREARSVTASDVCLAASRCESSGNEAAHAQQAFDSTFYVLPDHTLVDHKFSSSTFCRFGSSSQVNAWGIWTFVGEFNPTIVRSHAHSRGCAL